MKYTEWEKLGEDLLHIVFTQPLEYANVLIRVGYEPYPPVIHKNILGKEVLGLPNLATYVKHIYKVDGLEGFLPGLPPRLIGGALGFITMKIVNENLPLSDKEEDEDIIKKQVSLSSPDKFGIFLKKLVKYVISLTTATIVTHPFHVVTIRTMAQFVGKETKYNGILSPLKVIYNEQGVSGLYSGLAPRLFRDVSNVILVAFLSYLVRSYISKQRCVRITAHGFFTFIVRNITYPLQVVTTCMAVNDPGLKAGSPPALPMFTGGWVECWRYLSETNQLTRGLYPILRYMKLPSSDPTVISRKLITVIPDLLDEKNINKESKNYQPDDREPYVIEDFFTNDDHDDINSGDRNDKFEDVMDDDVNSN